MPLAHLLKRGTRVVVSGMADFTKPPLQQRNLGYEDYVNTILRSIGPIDKNTGLIESGIHKGKTEGQVINLARAGYKAGKPIENLTEGEPKFGLDYVKQGSKDFRSPEGVDARKKEHEDAANMEDVRSTREKEAAVAQKQDEYDRQVGRVSPISPPPGANAGAAPAEGAATGPVSRPTPETKASEVTKIADKADPAVGGTIEGGAAPVAPAESTASSPTTESGTTSGTDGGGQVKQLRGPTVPTAASKALYEKLGIGAVATPSAPTPSTAPASPVAPTTKSSSTPDGLMAAASDAGVGPGAAPSPAPVAGPSTAVSAGPGTSPVSPPVAAQRGPTQRTDGSLLSQSNNTPLDQANKNFRGTAATDPDYADKIKKAGEFAASKGWKFDAKTGYSLPASTPAQNRNPLIDRRAPDASKPTMAGMGVVRAGVSAPIKTPGATGDRLKQMGTTAVAQMAADAGRPDLGRKVINSPVRNPPEDEEKRRKMMEQARSNVRA